MTWARTRSDVVTTVGTLHLSGISSFLTACAMNAQMGALVIRREHWDGAARTENIRDVERYHRARSPPASHSLSIAGGHVLALSPMRARGFGAHRPR